MADFVRVANRNDIPAGEARMFEVNGRQVAVFHTAGGFHAIDNVCAHQGGPLAEGELDGNTVTCPWHGWTYDVSSGVSPDDADCSVERFEVKIEGDDLLVAV
jgi:nitrite reductase/ring-hydroxylating ferredoxin subunit